MCRLPGSTQCVFSFWVGHPEATQNRTLALCAACPTVDTLVVFRARFFSTPLAGTVLPGRFRACLPLFSDDQGMLAVVAVLEKLDSLSPAHGQWRLERQMSVNAYGSGQQFTAWIFRRSPSDKARAMCTQ